MCRSNVWDNNSTRLFKRRAGLGKGGVWPTNRIDPCITQLINSLNGNPNMVTLASCCGHGVYPLTVVVKDYSKGGKILELLTGKEIRGRTKKFYRSDKEGRYYLPEVSRPA